MKAQRLLDIALGVALGRLKHKQKWRLGAAGIRSDGVLVVSFNGAPKEPEWKHHSESRICRKLTPDSIIAVVRVQANGEVALAKPCENCQKCLAHVGVRKVYYSIGSNEFGIMIF